MIPRASINLSSSDSLASCIKISLLRAEKNHLSREEGLKRPAIYNRRIAREEKDKSTLEEARITVSLGSEEMIGGGERKKRIAYATAVNYNRQIIANAYT